ncbi:MAG: RNase H-like domain-containing protein [Arsenophonus sp. ER-EMS1-MAG3]
MLYASDYTTGGVLYQCDENFKHNVIAHVHRSTQGSSRNYFYSAKEILAIVYL